MEAVIEVSGVRIRVATTAAFPVAGLSSRFCGEFVSGVSGLAASVGVPARICGLPGGGDGGTVGGTSGPLQLLPAGCVSGLGLSRWGLECGGVCCGSASDVGCRGGAGCGGHHHGSEVGAGDRDGGFASTGGCTGGGSCTGAGDVVEGAPGESLDLGSGGRGCAVESSAELRRAVAGGEIASGVSERGRSRSGTPSAVDLEREVKYQGKAPPGAGKNWARNQVWKENKRGQRARRRAVAAGAREQSPRVGGGFFSGVPEESLLRSSRATRLIAENKLAEERARVAAQVLSAVDVEDKIRCERARLVQMTEKNLVSASRSHAALNANGDGFVEGKRVETLVGSAAASSGLLSSISPSSSVSEAEVRALFKRLADVEHRLAEKERALKVANVRLGLDPEGEKEKDEWTVGDNGELLAASLVEEAMPDGYAMLDVYGVPDKVRLIPCRDI